MREKLNENPLAQVAVLGVLALIVGFLLITRMSGGSDETATPAATDSTPTTEATATTPALPTTPPEGVAPASTPDGAAIPATGGKFKAGPGLPKDVVKAYDSGKVVVLLVVRNGGIDDDKVKATSDRLRGRSDTALFVVETKNVADYSRIAQGVDLRQTPALIVLRPKKLNQGPEPTATVEYGFRGPDSVTQVVEDALYKGPDDLPYYPH